MTTEAKRLSGMGERTVTGEEAGMNMVLAQSANASAIRLSLNWVD
ncbi:MAG: hypothetical protein UHD09_06160 [Bifidobacterium sp.]|nr:hypothetical protein [Bifidobacterium sp.]